MSKEYVIKRGDKTFTPSIYQKEILEFAREGVGDAFINACAGSSKTTILENIVYQLPTEKKICFIAFNNSIVDEMKNRMGETDKNIHITTYHSLGYSILRENHPTKTFIIDINKYENYVRQNLLILTNYNEVDSLGENYYMYYKNIIQLISYARYYHRSNVIGIRNISEKFEMTLYRDECEVCKKVLDWGRKNLSVIDYTDMVWLVNELNLNTKRHKYDAILIDEVQDTTVMQHQMTERCVNRGCRKITVGDKYQSINIWCGSDFDAIEKYKTEKTKEFQLPISYRCPKKVVELAKRYSPNIMCDENAEEGEIRYNVSVNDPIGNDMVLCRNMAPLVMQFQKYLKINKKCYLNGAEDVSKTLKEIIYKSNSIYIDINCMTRSGLFPKLYTMLNNTILKLVNEGLPLEDIYTHISVLELYDNINCIKVLCDNIVTTEELINKIDAIFSDNDNEGVMLSTVHKAKGLETDNVFILYPSLLPNKYVKKEWEKKSEEHIVYVAYTRCRKTLNFIEEDFRSTRTNASFNYEKMIEDIQNIATKLNVSLPTPEVIKKKNKLVKLKKEKKNTTHTPKTKKETKKGGVKYSNIF